MKEKDSKQKAKKNKKQSLNNKKHRDNRILKAKDILAKNKEALQKQAEKKEENEKRSLPVRILHIVKRIILVLIIAAFAIALISFVIVRVNGGTPEIFGYSVQRIISGSMEPTLQVGDIILCKKVTDPSEVKVDDIITFRGNSDFEYNYVTHRVVAPPEKNINGEYVLTTKGDANNIVDKEISFSSVHSKFIRKIDFLNSLYELFLSPWGLLIFIAALIIIFFDELLTVVKVFTGNYKDDEEEEDESIKGLMESIRTEEEEEQQRQNAERERKRRIYKKYGSTSNKKKERQKNQKKNTQKDIDKQDQSTRPVGMANTKTRNKRSKKKKK